MMFFAYFSVVIFFAYWLGKNAAGYGVFVFFVGVLLWQVSMDGPASLLASNGCLSYGHAAKDC